MSVGQTPLQMTVVAAEDGGEYVALTFAGEVAGAGTSDHGEAIIGFADHSFKSGQAVRVNYGCVSTAISGAAIDGTENRLITAAGGKVIPWTSGSIVAARLMPGQTASAAGEKILVFVMPGQA